MSPARAPVVSILIVNYRAYGELTACLESLQRFPSDDIEVIVVDHGGEPGSTSALRGRFPSVTLIEVQANPGFAAGVNRAARAASGKYLLLLNPDCLVNEELIRPLAKWLDDHPRVGALGTLVREADGSIQASARRFPNVTTGFAGRTAWLTRVWPGNPWTQRNLLIPTSSRDPIEVDWVSGACMAVRREAFDAVGGMDEQFFLYWEDADFCYRLKSEGWSTVYYPAVVVTHLTSRSSAQARTASLVAFHRSAYRYFRKHGGRRARIASPIVFLALYGRLLLKLAWIRLRG